MYAWYVCEHVGASDLSDHGQKTGTLQDGIWDVWCMLRAPGGVEISVPAPYYPCACESVTRFPYRLL